MATTTERGLGYEHQQHRKAMLPLAYGTNCEYCGRVMLKGMKLHLDHRLARVLGGTSDEWNLRIIHAWCNLSRGGRQFGHRRVRKAKPPRW